MRHIKAGKRRCPVICLVELNPAKHIRSYLKKINYKLYIGWKMKKYLDIARGILKTYCVLRYLSNNFYTTRTSQIWTNILSKFQVNQSCLSFVAQSYKQIQFCITSIILIYIHIKYYYLKTLLICRLGTQSGFGIRTVSINIFF